MNLLDLARSVSDIARDAGNAILNIYNADNSIAVEHKADNSPLTIADKASNAVIMEGLKKLLVQYPIISEENKEVPYEVRSAYEYYWLVDPLDGTKEFIKRNGEFTVNIALIYQQRPVLGVVYAPCLDEMYYAAKSEGAYLNKGGETRRLYARAFHLDDAGLNLVSSRSHLNAETEAFIAKFRDPGLVSKGSSLKFLMIASGEAHVYPRIAPTMEWDTAAAQMVVEESGGSILEFESGEALHYNKVNLLNPHFVAYGKVLAHT